MIPNGKIISETDIIHLKAAIENKFYLMVHLRGMVVVECGWVGGGGRHYATMFSCITISFA